MQEYHCESWMSQASSVIQVGILYKTWFFPCLLFLLNIYIFCIWWSDDTRMWEKGNFFTGLTLSMPMFLFLIMRPSWFISWFNYMWYFMFFREQGLSCHWKHPVLGIQERNLEREYFIQPLRKIVQKMHIIVQQLVLSTNQF